ncbi:MAG: efflux RND transporter periplasmic adaptor subunit [Undibacterium sp.]|nr:efflux RND transporter periplasmic adaptor subunit [Undibacterium sp.]
MKTKNILMLISIAAVLSSAGFGVYRLGLNRGVQQATISDVTAKKAAAAERKILYWHDPMSPATKFDKPGKSPFMDMQLVPVYADEAADEGAGKTSGVSINPRMQQNLGIRLAEVTRGHLGAAINAVGSVAYNENELVLVQARSNGFVEKLYVRATLEAVRKDQPLAQLYVPEWIAVQEEFLTVKTMPDAVSGLLDGARQRMRLAGMNEQQIALVESSGKVQAHFTLTAPASGIVTELAAREGMTVMAGAPLFKINGLDQVWINAELAENAASQVRIGNAVEVRSPALGAQVLHGKVSALLPEINPTTRTQKARITLANPVANASRQFVPGMFVNVSVVPANSQEVLLVPSEAVIPTGSRSVVMLADGAGKFRPVEVETGSTENGQTAILRGLEAGQKVVASGQFLIDSEASLRGSTARMTEPEKQKTSTVSHHAEGKIDEIAKDEIIISHGPIASLNWGAMSMGFTPPLHGMPADIKVGSKVSFDFSLVGDGQYQIHRISVISAGAKK